MFTETLKLSVGCNLSFDQLMTVKSLNSLACGSVRVTEFYGSLHSSYLCLPSARPDYRLPDNSWEHFSKFISMCNVIDIDFNYTCNGPLNTSVWEFKKNRAKYEDAFRKLEEIGVARLTMTNPLLIETALESCDLPINISTIMHPSVTAQLPYFKNWRVDRVCLNLYKNRDIAFLRNYNAAAKLYQIDPVLIVNEFCMYGNSPCLGILRDACYTQSAFGGNPEGFFNGWPFMRCHTERLSHPEAWLQACFILPDQLSKYYSLTGISHFKVTGRTFPLDLINRITHWYVQSSFNEPIPMLWSDHGNPDVAAALNSCDIRPSELEDVNFFDRWLIEEQPCDYSCGVSCRYCAEKFKEILDRRDSVG